jgi:hypothetical protein
MIIDPIAGNMQPPGLPRCMAENFGQPVLKHYKFLFGHFLKPKFANLDDPI